MSRQNIVQHCGRDPALAGREGNSGGESGLRLRLKPALFMARPCPFFGCDSIWYADANDGRERATKTLRNLETSQVA